MLARGHCSLYRRGTAALDSLVSDVDSVWLFVIHSEGGAACMFELWMCGSMFCRLCTVCDHCSSVRKG